MRQLALTGHYQERRPMDADPEAPLASVREVARHGGARKVMLLLETEEGRVVDHDVRRETKRGDGWEAAMKIPSRRTL